MGFLESFLSAAKGLKKKVYVITYHGIVEERAHAFWERNFTRFADFKDHIDFFSKYKILSTDELIEHLKTARPPEVPCFYITFDDGYKNNLIAADFLAKRRIPWTIFLSTGCISKGDYIWTVDLGLMFRYTKVSALHFGSEEFAMTTEDQKVAAFNAIRKLIKKMNAHDRKQVMVTLQDLTGAQDLASWREKAPSFEMLNWDSARQLSGAAEIGSHGVYHELLHKDQDPSVTEYELHESRRQIEMNIGKPCRVLAYPNGDFSDKTKEVAASCQYQLAFSVIEGALAFPADRFALPRIDALGTMAKLKQKLMTL